MPNDPVSRPGGASTRGTDQLRLLVQVSEAIATHRDLPALFRDLAKRLPSIVAFEFIGLFLHDPEKKVMRVDLLGTADADSIPPGFEVPVDGSFSGLVFTTQQPVIVRSQEEAARFPPTASLMQRMGTESFCILPLTTIVRPLGAMGFGSRSPRAFDEAELEFLELVVKQVAVAVDNVLHDESAAAAQAELTRERDRLRLLLEVSESVAAHHNLNELIHDLAQRLPRVVPFDYINLTLHDPVRNIMRLQLLVAPDDDGTLRPGFELPMDSPSGLAWSSQQPVMVEDLDAESRFPQLTALLRENQVQSWCAVPLTTALRRLGAMGFGSATPRRYEDADVAFLQQVANQVAVTVDNVLHHESAESAQRALEYKRDRLQLLLEVTSAVVSHLNLDDVFAAVSAMPAAGHPARWFQPVAVRAGHGPVPHLRPEVCRQRQLRGGGADRSPHSIKSPAAVAITTRRPALFGVEELERMAPESKAASRILAEGIKSFCAVPLLSHDRVLGALNVGSARPDAFSESDVELLRQVAQQVAIAVENAVAYREIAELKEKLNTEKLYLEAEIRTEQNFDEIVGQSPALTQVLKQVEIVAPTESTVLIQGETGTGKELLARAIHNLSARRARTFVKLNCAAIPTGLLESELFGHERGAFTGAIGQKIGRFELAQGGNPVPRRGRRHSAGAAVEVPARAAGTGIRAPRQHPDHPGGHAARGRDQS